MDLAKTLSISASGMKAQGARLKTIAENLANAESLAPSADADPYRRKVVTFKSALDRANGVNLVRVGNVNVDRSTLQTRYDPQHPSANESGYVKLPNVNPLIEIMDMREAQRSYEANLNTMEVARGMLLRTLDILRA